MQKGGGQNLTLADNEDTNMDDTWAPLLTTSVRTLYEWENVAGDFSRGQTLSEILKELPGGMNKRLNDIDIETAIQAAQKFSSSTFSVKEDPPAPSDQAKVRQVTVDVDSVSATFIRRERTIQQDRKRDKSEIYRKIRVLFKDDHHFFNSTTSFIPYCNSMKPIPSETRKYGPTIEPYPKGGYYRIQLPTPLSSEVFKIWIYAPKTFKDFAKKVHKTANECAKDQAEMFFSSMTSALTAAIESSVSGFRPFDIPGGYMFPICIALILLEQHPECSFALETYNCKKKGFRLQPSPENFGDDSWSNALAADMKTLADDHRNMLKFFCKLDRVAKIEPHLSKIGFGIEMMYNDKNGSCMYSLCNPSSEHCDHIVTYPLAFLPKQLASRLTFLKNGDRIQTYMPVWHQANWRRAHNDREQVSNLGFRHCIAKGSADSLNMNVTELLRGAKKEQILIDDVIHRFRRNFSERIEIATSWSFSNQQRLNGLLCFNGNTQGSRWLDLESMVRTCVGYVKQFTQFWDIGPIADYMTLNFASTFTLYHTTARAMADQSLVSIEREQCCRSTVYVNQLLRVAKDGKLWQKNNQPKLSLLTRGARHNRELMLPQIPSCVFSVLAEAGCILLRDIPKILPVIPQNVITLQATCRTINDRIIENKTLKNNFGLRVLRCRCCGMCFYGGRGLNDNQLFKYHLKENPSHAVGSSNNEKMTNSQWFQDYCYRMSNVRKKYEHVYDVDQRRAYDAVLSDQSSVLLLGIAGSGKSWVVQDLLYVLRCLFWKKNEVHVCGATHAVAQRMENTASTFHSFLGIRCDQDETGAQKWDFSVDEYLQKIRSLKKSRKNNLATVRVVVLDEGLEVPSNLMEAYFRYIQEAGLNIISIVAGDVCQGVYREDQETGRRQNTFFSNPMKLASLCPSLKIVTFNTDHRTKCVALKKIKSAVRNAEADSQTETYVQEHQYKKGQTSVDIVLCARIRDMLRHNDDGLRTSPNQPMTYKAVLDRSSFKGHNYPLAYKYNGVQDTIVLKIGAPIMIMQTYEVECGTKLRNGTQGIVSQLQVTSVTIDCGKDRFEIQPVKIFGTQWMQLPLCTAYAGTIAKCIGFEFNSVAIDFGMTSHEDGKALWRQKQAYTAISRAKQECYFVGIAPLTLLNNMDMNSLCFFKCHDLSKGQRMKDVLIVRNVFEMAEFWVHHSNMKGNKRDRDTTSYFERDPRNTKYMTTCGKHIEARTMENQEIKVFAENYPNCFQNLEEKGHLLVATSQDRKELLLKRRAKKCSIDYQTEIEILKACSNISGVLKLVAVAESGIVLEIMKDKVSWNYFVKHSSSQAREAFCANLENLVQELNQQRIAHKNISQKTLIVDMNGNVKLTWFDDAEMPATTTMLQKDKHAVQELCKSLYTSEDCEISNCISDIQDDEQMLESTGLMNIANTDDQSHSSTAITAKGDITNILKSTDPKFNGFPEVRSCGSRLIQIPGSAAQDIVDSPMIWLLEACLEIELIPRPATACCDTPENIISLWDRDVKHTTKERHLTRGGITEADFWPKVFQKCPQSKSSAVFTDFGSEYFLQGLLCALLGNFREVVGIEIDLEAFEKSVQLARLLVRKAQEKNKYIANIVLLCDDFLKNDAVYNITARSTVVYANNVVFGHNNNAALTDIWQNYLPADAIIVLFDETAILSSGDKRVTRCHDRLRWVSKTGEVETSVSWQPHHKTSVHLWRVESEYTKLRDWAAKVDFDDLLGWALYYMKAQLFEGGQRYSLRDRKIVAFWDIQKSKSQWSAAFDQGDRSVFLAITTSQQDYVAAIQRVLQKLDEDPSNRAKLNCIYVIDLSECNPVMYRIRTILESKIQYLLPQGK